MSFQVISQNKFILWEMITCIYLKYNKSYYRVFTLVHKRRIYKHTKIRVPKNVIHCLSDILRWDCICFLEFFTSFSRSEPPGNPSR